MMLKALLVTGVLSLVSAAHAEQIISHSESEICVIPDRAPVDGADYSGKDGKREAKLCSYDFHAETSTETVTAVALCPKLFSIYPAVELIEIPEGATKSDYEGKSCNKKVGAKNQGKKLAKYKNSMSCAKTPSIVGYYHISRILGIDNIPVSVLRTMKKETHLEVAENGKAYAKSNPGELVAKNWVTLAKMLSVSDPAIMSDKDHSIGGLSENPRGEQKYYEDFYPGAGGLDGVKKFKTVKVYGRLGTAKHVSKIVGKDLTTENYTSIQKMKDAADLIVLDTLFGQQDRFGNVHSYHIFLVQEAEGVKKYSMSDIEDMIKENGSDDEKALIKKADGMPSDWRKEVEARTNVLLSAASSYMNRNSMKFAHAQEMLLKDNDCGLKVSNVFKGTKMIESVKHMNRKTYTQLIKLYEQVSSGKMDTFLANTAYMDEKEMAEFKDGLEYVAKDLSAKCAKKELYLDLNVKDHFNGQNNVVDACGAPIQ